MLIIDTAAAMARALDQPLDPCLKRLLSLRRDQAGDAARIIVVQAGDAIASVEAAIGFPLVLDYQPTWEWVQRHDGDWIEVVFILSDDGPADVLLVPDGDDTDAGLSALLHLHAADELDRQQLTVR